MGNSKKRSFCIKNFSLETSSLCMETGPNKQSNICTKTERMNMFPYAFSSFNLIGQVLKKLKKKM